MPKMSQTQEGGGTVRKGGGVKITRVFTFLFVNSDVWMDECDQMRTTRNTRESMIKGYQKA